MHLLSYPLRDFRNSLFLSYHYLEMTVNSYLAHSLGIFEDLATFSIRGLKIGETNNFLMPGIKCECSKTKNPTDTP